MFNFFRQGRNYARLREAVPLVVREERRQRHICRKIAGATEKDFEELPRFGPLYSIDESEILKDYKEEALEHVLVKTGGNMLETTENYLSAIGDVEREAIDCYADVTMVESETEFRWMMLKDGCFLIQLAILILGGSSVLGYPKNHEIFGKNKRNDAKRWLKSLFYVGNQIPLVVIQKLMEQQFFQKLLEAGKWKEPSDSLKRVLYELLIVPYTRNRNSSWQITFPTTSQGPTFTKKSQLPTQRSSDLLHFLHSFVIGTRKNTIEAIVEDIDLELGHVEDAVDDKEFPSATKLFQAGIGFRNVKGMGCGGIYFKTCIVSSLLFMPTLTVDDNTLSMFEYLLCYERTQQPNRQKRQVCAYLKFMSELVQTTEDVRLLDNKGIIKGYSAYKENLPQILSNLAHGESSDHLRRLRLQINEYSQPAWLKYIGIISIAFFLTVLQTVFGILSYIDQVNRY